LRNSWRLGRTTGSGQGYAVRAEKLASKLQSKVPAGGASLDAANLEVTLAVADAGVKALAELKGALVKLKYRFPSEDRVSEQGNGRGGYRNAKGTRNVVRQSGLPELTANLVRSAAELSNLVRSAVQPEKKRGRCRGKAVPVWT
jgi:hypothetical protein